MTDAPTKTISLSGLRQMKDQGQLVHNPTASEGEELGPDFWANAVLESPRQRRSVHLRLDAEVYDFFHDKTNGKGHLTQMQNVLRAYVRAHR
jgi:uncharacterized protein (DUF4415 family)